MTAQPTTADDHRTIAGHPTGLFVLFFAEMWERFSYYGMRALLVFYMIKGFLGYGDSEADSVYGAYTALVYATPFIGGMLADRLLGARKAVVLGGALMAGGHLLMTIEQETTFFVALALLIVGNGFFKPNISTIVGSLYEKDPSRKDAGFTLFYMGINLGAAMAPLLRGYVGENYGWHYGFGLATIGMLVGLAVFVVPALLAQLLVLGGALATAGAMVWLQDDALLLIVNGFVAVALVVAAVVSFVAIGRGALPDDAGAPPKRQRAEKVMGMPAEMAMYVGVAVAIVVLAFVVQANAVAGWILSALGAVALAYLIMEAMRAEMVERHRLFVVLILMFFTMLFWAFFEQAGSSVNLFTDRNVDRVTEERVLTDEDVGKAVTLTLSQEQLGYEQNGQVFTLDQLDKARDAKALEVEWQVEASHVGMGIGGPGTPASVFQSANPIYIVIFGLIFSALWSFLGSRGLEPSTPVKFALGIIQLGLGFGALWYGTQHATDRGMVWVGWLLIGYLLQTTGELCLSPVGLSMVTKLSPPRLVSTVMGAWFLATAFSNYLAAVIATFTGVEHGSEGAKTIPPPAETVHVYGEVFASIALAAVIAGVVLLALAPLLKKWMHEDEEQVRAASPSTTPAEA